MSRSTRFTSAVHILTLLALKQGEYCSSQWMAKSVGTNPVVVRRIIALLDEAGLVSTRIGSHGGTKLAVDPNSVTLRTIYEAVEEDVVISMHDPHPKCPVACQLKSQVGELIDRAEEKMKADLARTKLSAITRPALAAIRQSKA